MSQIILERVETTKKEDNLKRNLRRKQGREYRKISLDSLIIQEGMMRSIKEIIQQPWKNTTKTAKIIKSSKNNEIYYKTISI